MILLDAISGSTQRIVVCCTHLKKWITDTGHIMLRWVTGHYQVLQDSHKLRNSLATTISTN